MAIKKLQQNFTTPEQSKRLLELGLPADSADCYARTDSCSFYPSFLLTAKSSILCKNDVLYTDFCASLERCNMSCIPIWSVGRLIEIYCILTNAKEFKMYTIGTLVEEIIYLLNTIKINGADFSKLEE